MSPDQVVTQFQQILTTLQRIVNASSNLSDRVDALEQGSGEILGKLTEIQGHIQIVIENLQAERDEQRQVNDQLARTVADLTSRVAALEQR